ncbi:MAG: hypothetical protein PHF84_11005 [bacterium]|nr:hypothetical protein [bacterium]
MVKDNLYSFDNKSIDFNTNDLDDIISNDEILKNFKDETKESLIFDEDKIDVLKEEPVLESLDSLQASEPVMPSVKPAEKEPEEFGIPSGAQPVDLRAVEEESVLFSDEPGEAVDMKLEEEKTEPRIVADTETEKYVKNEIIKEMSEEAQAVPASDAEAQAKSSFFDEDEDETISLSSEELSNILEDTEETPLTQVPTVEKILEEKAAGSAERAPDKKMEEFLTQNVMGAEAKETPLESEEISLDEIPVEEIDLGAPVLEESAAGLSLPEEKTEAVKPGSFFEEEEDESIGLTGSELDNILKSTEIVEESLPAEEMASGLDQGISLEQPPEETGESAELSELIPLEPESSLSAETFRSESNLPETMFGEKEGLDDQKLKKILKYLDSLLDYLPEDKIKEFAESEYYDLYHSLFNDLKI